MKVNLLSTMVTIDQGNLVRNVITNWNKDLLDVNHLTHGNWVCVFQDMKPLKSILRKSTNMQRPIHRVKFTKAMARHTKIRDQNPSLGNICPGEPHQRSPNAPKFEDRSQEETEWQEQRAREAAWKLAKSVLMVAERRFVALEELLHSCLRCVDVGHRGDSALQCPRDADPASTDHGRTREPARQWWRWKVVGPLLQLQEPQEIQR